MPVFLPHSIVLIFEDLSFALVGAEELRWCMGRLCDDASGSMAAFRIKAVDTTGAGDAFCAGLLHALGASPHVDMCVMT